MISIFTDGGSRGNPGHAAIGVYIIDKDKNKMHEFGENIGIATNNVAEYKAVVATLSWLIENEELIEKDSNISFFTDSQLIYSQIVGLYKIKDAKLRELLFKIREKEAQIKGNIRYFQITREQNKNADRLVNKALDNEAKFS